MQQGAARARDFWVGLSFSRATLAKVLAVLTILSLVPLAIIALYNYPADDDFGFTLPAATAWVQTHSLPAVLKAMVATTLDTYRTWQGYFVSTFLFALNPLIFDIRLYFLSNWAQLLLLCLSVGYALKGVTRHQLKAPRAAFWISYAAVLLLCVQFMPHIGYGLFWHNGGNYVTAVCTLLLTLGLLLRLGGAEGHRRRALRSVLAPACGFLLGGMFFGPALAGMVMLGLVAVGSFATRSRIRWQSLMTLLAFGASFAISFLSPGNALRVGADFTPTGVPYAVLASVQEALKLTGQWLSPQLLAAGMLILPALAQPLQQSAQRFRHPLLVGVLLFGTFAASLTTGLYTGVGYTFERYHNAVYLYFVLMAIGCMIYWAGALIRLAERRAQAGVQAAQALLEAGKTLGQHFGALYLSICLALLFLGGLTFPIMNTASISATRSLVSGEAATFRQEMAQRAEYIRVTDSDAVAIQPLSVQVNVFKYDRLPFQGTYGRVRYMKWYYELFHSAGQ